MSSFYYLRNTVSVFQDPRLAVVGGFDVVTGVVPVGACRGCCSGMDGSRTLGLSRGVWKGLTPSNSWRSEYKSLLWTKVELNKMARTVKARSRPCSPGVGLDWTMSKEGLRVSKAGRYPHGERIVYQMRVATGLESSWCLPLCRA